MLWKSGQGANEFTSCECAAIFCLSTDIWFRDLDWRQGRGANKLMKGYYTCGLWFAPNASSSHLAQASSLCWGALLFLFFCADPSQFNVPSCSHISSSTSPVLRMELDLDEPNWLWGVADNCEVQEVPWGPPCPEVLWSLQWPESTAWFMLPWRGLVLVLLPPT